MFKDIYIEIQGGIIIEGISIIAMQYIGLSNPGFQNGNLPVHDYVFKLVSGEEIFGRITDDQRNILNQKIGAATLFYLP